MNLVDDFVSFKLSRCFDLSESSELEANQVINWLRSHYLYHLSVELENSYFDLEELRLYNRNKVKLMEESNEDLFKKFYNDEKILVSSMSTEDFRIHEEELARVAFEAKARITAIVHVKKERNAALKVNQKDWLIQKDDAEEGLVSDAINTVNTRKKRMNKIDKLNEMLSGFVDEETRKKIVGTIENKATEKQVSLISFVKTREEEVKKEIAETKAEEKKPETNLDDALKNLFK